MADSRDTTENDAIEHQPESVQGHVICSVRECDWSEDSGVGFVEHAVWHQYARVTYEGVTVEGATMPDASPDQAESDRMRDLVALAIREEFIDAVLDTVVSEDVGELNLRVKDIVAIAKWLAPVYAALVEQNRTDDRGRPSNERATTDGGA